jgi:hypothetical protein
VTRDLGIARFSILRIRENYSLTRFRTSAERERFRTSAEREGLGTPKEASASGRQTSAIRFTYSVQLTLTTTF